MSIKEEHLDTYTRNSKCINFYVKSVTFSECNNYLHRHNYFQIILLIKGNAVHSIDFNTYRMNANSVSVIFPQQIHHLALSEEAEAKIIMFDETVFCSEILANELKEYNINLQQKINYVDLKEHPNASSELLDFNRKIKSLHENINPLRKMQVKFMIKVMLLKIIDLIPDSATHPINDKDTRIYIQFREMVDLLYKTQRKINPYAVALGVSAKKLTAICNLHSGMSPLALIHDKLSLELKKIFISDSLSLKEIAYEFGFSSQSALNKYVYRKFSCTPLEFRQMLLDKVMGRE